MSTQVPHTLAARFLAAAAVNPDRIAIEEGSRTLSYAELRGQASALAHHLQAAGVGPDSLVVLCGARSLDYFLATLAVSLAGGAYLPIAPDTPPARLQMVLEAARPQLVLADADVASLFANWPGRVERLVPPPAAGAVAEPPSCDATPDSLAYVMFTSGSTGTPKGAAIPQTAVVQLVCDTNYIALDADSRVLVHSALTFDAVTFEIWGPLLNGGTLVVMPAGKPRLHDYVEILRDKAIDTAFFTPALFRELVDRDSTGFAPLRHLLTGGEVVGADHVRRALEANPRLRVIVVYGPTECTTFATTCEFGDPTGVPDPLPLGPAVAATEIRLLTPDGEPAATGEIGEIHIGGPRIGRGYLGRPDLTEAAFVHLADGARFYRTGDLAVRDKRGDLFFRGRSDRQIKLHGYRVEPEEIEAALRSYPGVAAAAVKTWDHGGSPDPMLVAYVVPDADAGMAVAEPGAGEGALTGQWRDVYSDLLYRGLASPDQAGADPTLNTAGWKSSYDGRHIDDAQMLEQVGQTVDRVLAMRPRHVLEIGCGTGMLLFRIAPHCETYVGTDLSPVAIDYVARQVAVDGLDGIVTLASGAADELPGAPVGGFDMVVINSVTEHFPSIDYLDAVLRKLRGSIAPGAHVYVGDNRNYSLLPLFHASVQLFRSEGSVPVPQFAIQVAQAIAEERQLTLDPAYFLQLGELGYRCCSLQCRRGHALNEMTAFRFDAMLRFDDGIAAVDASAPALGEPDLAALVAGAAAGPVAATGMRNARTIGGDLLIEAISGDSPLGTVEELRRAIAEAAPGLLPETAWHAAETHGLAVEVRPSIGSAAGDLDLWLAPPGRMPEAWYLPPRPLRLLANDPAQADRLTHVAAALRGHLQDRLPSYAVPSFIVALPRFMTTSHGKIDMAALPLPERLRQRRSEGRSAEPEDQAKTLLRRCWEGVLGLHDIEDDEDFFALGGNSLKAVRMVAEFKLLSGVSLSPALVFERPTLAGLATSLREFQGADTRVADTEDSRGRNRRAAVARQRVGAGASSPL